MTITRKNYEAIAEAIVESRNQVAACGFTDAVAQSTIALVVANLVEVFRADNPRFDVDRFIAATNRPKAEPVHQHVLDPEGDSDECQATGCDAILCIGCAVEVEYDDDDAKGYIHPSPLCPDAAFLGHVEAATA